MARLVVFEPDLSNYHDVDSSVSFRATVYYNGIGKFSLTLPETEYNARIFKVNCILIDKEKNNVFIVTKVTIDTEKSLISVNGFTANWILNKYTFDYYWQDSLNLEINEAKLYEYINESMQNPIVEMARIKGLSGDTTQYISSGGQLCDKVIAMSQFINFGNTIKYDTKKNKLIFELLKAQDLTTGIHQQVFSREMGTAKNLVINDDITNVRTGAFIVGELSDSTGTVRLMPHHYGNRDNELWVAERPRKYVQNIDYQQEQIFLYSNLVPACEREIQKHFKRLSFTVEIDGAELGKAYNLGDIVRCTSSEYNVNFTAPINAVSYTIDARGEKVNLLLGEPNLNIVDMIKQG